MNEWLSKVLKDISAQYIISEEKAKLLFDKILSIISDSKKDNT